MNSASKIAPTGHEAAGLRLRRIARGRLPVRAEPEPHGVQPVPEPPRELLRLGLVWLIGGLLCLLVVTPGGARVRAVVVDRTVVCSTRSFPPPFVVYANSAFREGGRLFSAGASVQSGQSALLQSGRAIFFALGSGHRATAYTSPRDCRPT